jgi:hypothetical protein
MNVAMGTLRRRERASTTRRRNAEGRATRERTRNARLALVGFVLLGAAITFGVRTTWTWTPAPIKITSMKLPADADSWRFAEDHTGRLFFDSLDGAICREMQFNNDTGRFSNDKSMRCDESLAKPEDVARGPGTEAGARTFSLRNGFSGR